MKKILFILILLFSSVFSNANQKAVFPDDFVMDKTILVGLSPTDINNMFEKELAHIDEFKEVDFANITSVIDHPLFISMLGSDFDNENVCRLYFEHYYNKNNDFDDAGVIVFEFLDQSYLQNILYQLAGQDNYAYLIKDNYLIQVWSDASYNSEQHIADMVKFYEDKIGAKVCLVLK